MRKIALTILSGVILFSVNANAQPVKDMSTTNSKVVPIKLKKESEPLGPLFLIDNQEKDIKEFERIRPDTIEGIEVLKGASAMTIYGSKAKYGAILVTTKQPKLVIRDAPIPYFEAITVIDNKLVGMAELSALKLESIVNIKVLKGEEAFAQFGSQAGVAGVILITTKNKKSKR